MNRTNILLLIAPDKLRFAFLGFLVGLSVSNVAVKEFVFRATLQMVDTVRLYDKSLDTFSNESIHLEKMQHMMNYFVLVSNFFTYSIVIFLLIFCLLKASPYEKVVACAIAVGSLFLPLLRDVV